MKTKKKKQPHSVKINHDDYMYLKKTALAQGRTLSGQISILIKKI